jgi:putative membrane protein
MAQFKTVFIQLVFISSIVLGTASCNSNQKTKNDTPVIAAQSETKRDTANAQKGMSDNQNDTLFLTNATGINLEEIKLGKLAQQKGKLTVVKKLAEMMQDDHSKSMISLTALAREKSITIPNSLNHASEADYKELNNVPVSNFDLKYCDMMVNGHKAAIAMFEKDSTELNNPDIKQWAIATLPTLRKHLAHSILAQAACEKIK